MDSGNAVRACWKSLMKSNEENSAKERLADFFFFLKKKEGNFSKVMDVDFCRRRDHRVYPAICIKTDPPSDRLLLNFKVSRRKNRF